MQQYRSIREIKANLRQELGEFCVRGRFLRGYIDCRKEKLCFLLPFILP
jgi:hypothetical protein